MAARRNAPRRDPVVMCPSGPSFGFATRQYRRGIQRRCRRERPHRPCSASGGA